MIEVVDRWEAYRKTLREHGVSEDEIEKAVAYQERIAKMCADLICMVCGGPMTRKLDPRQAGAPPGSRVFYNYRCPKRCEGSMVDNLEPLDTDLN